MTHPRSTIGAMSAEHFSPWRAVCRPCDVLGYIKTLWESQASFDAPEKVQVERMKKFLNYLGEGVGPDGRFLHQIRRAETKTGFFGLCREFLDHDQPMPLEPESEQQGDTYRVPVGT